MKSTRIMMGMPITVEVIRLSSRKEPLSRSWGHFNDRERGSFRDPALTIEDIDSRDINDTIEAVFDYFNKIDQRFSTYKPESEISRINRGELAEKDWSDEMAIVFALSEDTRQHTNGFFNIKRPDGSIDPSGLVKGWAIWNASRIIHDAGFENFYLDVGGDIQANGKNAQGETWTVGIKNPFKQDEVVKTIYARPFQIHHQPVTSRSRDANDHDQNHDQGLGIATSGTYIRGEHIYNPKEGTAANQIVSLTVIGPNIYEADRFATAAFAMGEEGINFIEHLENFEGYMIDKNGIATMTSGFETFTEIKKNI